MNQLRVAFVVGVALLALSCSQKETTGAVRVEVDFDGFHPGCMDLIASDGQHSLTQPFARIPDGTAGSLVGAVFGKADWGRDLQIEVQAGEGSCAFAGRMVLKESVTLPEPGEVKTVKFHFAKDDRDGDGYVLMSQGGHDCDDNDAAVHPGAPELCDEVNQNCDPAGLTKEGFEVGASCTTGGCTGTFTCASAQAVTCTASQISLYPDTDHDGHGANVTPTPGCLQPDSGFVESHDDCDDASGARFPGNPEVCDDLDNDCNFVADDNLPVSETWYPDQDDDHFGNPDGGVRTCHPGPGYTHEHTDCDDGDSFANPGQAEICDGRDNNCDGQLDPGNCGVVDWAGFLIGNDSLHTVTTTSFDGGVVWAAGIDHKVFSRPGTGFGPSPAASPCSASGNNFNASWADPTDGAVYLAGQGGDFARVQGTVCAFQGTGAPFPGNPELTGVVGFRLPSLAVYTVSSTGVSARWNGTAFDEQVATMGGLRALGLHGLSPGLMFAVGYTVSGPNDRPAIVRYQPHAVAGQPGSWKAEPLPPAVAALNARLRAVWVVNTRLAYAVGDGGLVLEWNGAAWSAFRKQVTNPANLELRSVLSFGSNRLYSVSRFNLYEFDGSDWALKMTMPDQNLPEFWDIGGSSPGDVYAVGSYGFAYHFPGVPPL